jgi:hypothetical protein
MAPVRTSDAEAPITPPNFRILKYFEVRIVFKRKYKTHVKLIHPDNGGDTFPRNDGKGLQDHKTSKHKHKHPQSTS